MAAVAHGMKGSGVPVRVAKRFLHADESKGIDRSRHRHSRKSWKSSKPFKN